MKVKATFNSIKMKRPLIANSYFEALHEAFCSALRIRKEEKQNNSLLNLPTTCYYENKIELHL